MENIKQPEKTKEQQLYDQLFNKHKEIEKNLNKLNKVLDDIKSIGDDVGIVSAKVMTDVKYNDEIKNLFENDKRLWKEILDLDKKLEEEIEKEKE